MADLSDKKQLIPTQNLSKQALGVNHSFTLSSLPVTGIQFQSHKGVKEGDVTIVLLLSIEGKVG